MIGTKLSNRYELLREIGRGGMGVVYLAYDPLLEREVAVKVVTPALLSSETQERFKREAKIIAKMDHPGIVVVYDVGEHDQSLYFVMPFVRGTHLRSYIMDRSLRLGEVLHIGIQVAEALEYSHSQGVIHRDIKPENILVARGEGTDVRVRVTDFGLAVAASENRLTRSGAMVGTVAYFSPEQISGAELTGRSDIYSLATVLYECVTGQTPFEGEIQHVLYRILHEQVQSPRALGKEIEEELENILMQCLEKDPARRPAKAKDFAESLSVYRSSLQEEERGRILLSASDTIQRRKPQAAALIDRQEESAELQKRLHAAIGGECQFVVIGGEAGIGKSRLLDELEHLARARKARVLHGRFVEQDRSFPYQGFCEVIQEAFTTKSGASSVSSADFADLIPELSSLFPVLSELGERSSGVSSATISRTLSFSETRKIEDRTYIFELLARSLARISSGKLMVILLEDLHAAEISIDALQYIIRRLWASPTLVVATYRSTDIDKSHPIFRMLNSFHDDRRFSLITLRPFTMQEHREFLQTLTGSTKLDDRLVETLFHAAEGNPYFTRELVRSLMDTGGMIPDSSGSWILASDAGITSDSLPATIQKTVEKRIERLSEEMREILSIASILGKTFEFRDLEVLSEGRKEIDDAVDQFIRSGFIEEERELRGDKLMFSSGVVRDVLYSQISRRKRKSLHRRYAEHLEKRHAARLDRVSPQLLHHYIEGDVPEKILEYGMKVAKRSLETSAYEEAQRALKAVFDAMEDEEETNTDVEAEARILRSTANRMSGNIDQALKDLERAMHIFEEEKKEPSLLNTIALAAETAWSGRKMEETRKWVEKALEGSQDQTIRVRMLSLAATVANLAGEYLKAQKYVQELEQIQAPAKEMDIELPKGGTLVVALCPSLQLSHPAVTDLDEEGEVLANVFETLVAVDAQGTLLPWLCEKWEAQEAGRTFQFTIRSNVRMQNGKMLTAEMIKVSMERAIQLTQTKIQAFAAIRGLNEFLSGESKEVSGIEVRSPNELAFHLVEPLPIYPALLTDLGTGIAYPDGEKLVGTGPFCAATMEPDRVVLERNPDYWKGTPPLLDRIEFRSPLTTAQIAAGLRSGMFDLVRDLSPQDLEEVLRDRRLRTGLAEAPKKNTYFVLFNSASPICSSAFVRRALCGIIRPQDLVRGTLGRFSLPAEGLIPPGILGHDPGRRRHPVSREKVIELLESSKLNPPLRLRAAIHPILQDRYASLTQALMKAWSGIGVDIMVATPDRASYLESHKKNDQIDLMIGRYIADYDDPDNFTLALFHSQMGLYRNYFSSTGMDQWMLEARMETDPAIREKLYRKIEGLMIETAYLLPLFHDIDYRLAGPKVRGLELKSSPPYANYSEIGKSHEVTPSPLRRTEGGTIHIPIAGEMNNLDPSPVFMVGQMEVIPTIFETLTRETEGARIVPWLASHVQAEEGGRRFAFRLRNHVRFQDGRKLTARDVRYSFERLLQNKESTSRWPLLPIHGAQRLMDGYTRELEGFRIQSTHDFTIELDQPISFFPAMLAFPSTAIVPEGSESISGNWREGCIGTGPFRVNRFDPGVRLELEANPYYWREGFPKSDGIVYTFRVPPTEILEGFKSGKFSLAWDLFPSDVDALRRDTGFAPRYGETPRLSTYYVVFNIHRGPLIDERFRHQLVQSVDAEALVRRHLGRLAIPAHGLIPPGLLGYVRGHSLIRPAQKEPREIVRLTSIINSVYEGPYSSFLQELLSSFEQNGFEIQNISQTRSEYFRALASATADIVISRWIADYPDADTFVHGLLHTEKGIVGKVCGTPEIDKLIERARIETDNELRHDIYREVEEIISRRALMLPLFHEQAYCFARPELEGFQVTFSRTIVPFENLWIRR